MSSNSLRAFGETMGAQSVYDGTGQKLPVLPSQISATKMGESLGFILPLSLWLLEDPCLKTPSGTMRGNRNLVLNGGQVTNPSVTIRVTQDIKVAKCLLNPQRQQVYTGCTFQLNVWSPPGFSTSWQQYVFTYFTDGPQPPGLGASIEYFQGLDFPKPLTHICDQGKTLTNPPGEKIPSGYRLTIALETEPGRGCVTTVSFTIMDDSGEIASWTPNLESDLGLTTEQLAPAASLSLVLVGPANAEYALLSSGAGQFEYAASSLLTPSDALSHVETVYPNTGETANTFYGSMPFKPDRTFTQSFTRFPQPDFPFPVTT